MLLTLGSRSHLVCRCDASRLPLTYQVVPDIYCQQATADFDRSTFYEDLLYILGIKYIVGYLPCDMLTCSNSVYGYC
jgi:hypothetical protein